MIKKYLGYALALVAVVGLSSSTAFAAGETLEGADISALGVTSVGTIGTNGYIVLASVAGIIVAMILWRFAVKHAKKSVK